MRIKLILLFLFLSSGLFADTYNRGTFSEYETEHLQYQITQGWTETERTEGKISQNFYGEQKPKITRTLKEFYPIQNADNSDDYVWPKYTDNELITLSDSEYNNLIDSWCGDYE